MPHCHHLSGERRHEAHAIAGSLMRLFVSPTSPYARMARVVVREKHLLDRVEEVMVDPHDDPAELIAANPAGLIPALTRDDGPALFQSSLICAWLDHAPSDAPPLLPEGGMARLEARLGEALGQQLTDLSVGMVYENRRPEALRWREAQERRRTKALRIAAAARAYVSEPGAPARLGDIAIACALAHLDFRHPALDWRGPNAPLAAWLDTFQGRESMAATAPPTTA